MKKDRWKAVRKGKTFCAPACGCGCTVAEHAAVVKKAHAAAKVLGNGWRVNVWENLGWHSSAQKGSVSIFLNDDHCAVMSNSSPQIVAYEGTLRQALATALRIAKKFAKNTASNIAILERACK